MILYLVLQRNDVDLRSARRDSAGSLWTIHPRPVKRSWPCGKHKLAFLLLPCGKDKPRPVLGGSEVI